MKKKLIEIITIDQFEKYVRHAALADLNLLDTLEQACWPQQIKSSKETIQQRIEHYPQGQYVVEVSGEIVGAVYSQRISNLSKLKTVDMDTVSGLHTKQGKYIQLLALNVFPEYQDLSLGDYLLEHVLERAESLKDIKKVVGVTRCKEFSKQNLPYKDYIKQKNKSGHYIDPILRLHQRHGAVVEGSIPGYRKRDKENKGFGVIVKYDLQNRISQRISKYEAIDKASTREVGDIKRFVHKAIKECIGNEKGEGLSPTRPLMEMGLDSADILKLSDDISQEYMIGLEPTFFFTHNTAEKIITYLQNALNLIKNNTPEERVSKLRTSIKLSKGEKNVMTKASQDIAIVGYSFCLPGASNSEALWDILINKKSQVTDTPEGRINWPEWVDLENKHKNINKAGYLSSIDQFDASLFRISPREAELMDPQQRMLLELTWELLETSGYSPAGQKESKTGVYIGASGSDYELLLREQEGHETLTGTGTSLAMLANRLSYFYDFEGPSLQIDTACSSSLVAIHEAIKSIKAGEINQAIVGGIHLMCHPSKSLSYYQSNMLGADGLCHTFDEKANGYVRGEGAVLMLLKPLEAAIRDGDHIKGIIKGTAINHGGQSGGLTVPNPKKQQELLEAAYTNADVDVSTVSYVEAHGTGTSLGDPIEIAGLTAAFRNLEDRKKTDKPEARCGLGSVKSNLGHLEAAAGVAGLLKILVSMEKGELPPTNNFERLNPKIELKNSPFYVQHKKQPWKSKKGIPLRAGVSSFGIGGANAHVVLEEYPGGTEVACLPARQGSRESEVGSNTPVIIPLSAKNEDRLKEVAKNLLNYLLNNDYSKLSTKDYGLSAISYTLQTGREAMEERLAIVAKDLRDLKEQLIKYGEGKPDGFIIGNAKKDKSDTFIKGKAGKAYVKEAIKEKEPESLAQLWVKGVEIDWNLLYEDGQ